MRVERGRDCVHLHIVLDDCMTMYGMYNLRVLSIQHCGCVGGPCLHEQMARTPAERVRSYTICEVGVSLSLIHI